MILAKSTLVLSLQNFSNLKMKGKEINEKWIELLDHTINGLDSDPNFEHYPIREKSLSFFYTFLFELSKETNIDKIIPSDFQIISPFYKKGIKSLRQEFLVFFESLIENGLQTGEIKSRAFVSTHYNKLLWQSFLAIILFWYKDKSAQKEQTDLFVERVIHLVFDIYAPNALDASFDLIQFLWKNKLTK